ncbi:hypothetical protein PA10_00204 [Pseudomonas phage pPa_SNUABM_DT01]|nr:hypothetical protein PA10_00204 [Pseudomonas phage pPa_SNUABM_DT01]
MPVPQLPNIDTVQQKPVVEPVKVQPKEYQGATVDTHEVKFDQLLTYIAGQAWHVNYLPIVRGRDDDVRPLEPGVHPVFQQYKLIKGMELKVTSPLQPSQIGDTKDMTLKGSANVYGVVIPNVGDIIVGDVGDGREGLFGVTSSNRLTHYTATVHEIEYSLIRLMDQALADQLYGQNVVETLVFHKDFLDTGNDPLISEEETLLVNNLKEHYERLIALYFHDFYSRDRKSLLVPNQPRVTYDPFLVRYIKTILTTDDHPLMRHITEFNVQGDQTMYEFTFWNCLETMDHAMLTMSVHQAGIVDVKQFWNGRPTMNSIYYSGVEAVVYPDLSPTNVDAGYNNCHFDPVLTDLVRGAARFRELNRLFRDDLDLDPTLEIYEAVSPERAAQIKRVTVDDYYVLSKDFYLHKPDVKLSKLEALTMAAMKGEAIDIRTLDFLCTNAIKWDNVERFYYFPILFTLLRVYKRRIK